MSDDSRAKRVCYLFYGGFIITILVLMTPLIPGVYMFETDFVNLNNLSIGNIQGVDRILWGNWRACYFGNTTKGCTSLGWVANPYTFIIIENGNQAHAIVQKTWLRILFMGFVALLCVIVVVTYYVMASIQFDHSNSNPEHERMAVKIGAYMAGLVGLTVLVTLVLDCSVSTSIGNEMQSLGTGGITSVNTKKVTGFWLTMVATVLINLLALVSAYRTYLGSK